MRKEKSKRSVVNNNHNIVGGNNVIDNNILYNHVETNNNDNNTKIERKNLPYLHYTRKTMIILDTIEYISLKFKF